MPLQTLAATDRTMNDAAIDASLLAGVISVAPVPLWVIGPDGLVVVANRAALAFLGYGREDDVVGGPSHDLLHAHRPDGSEYHRQSCPIVCAAGERGAAAQREWFVTEQGDLRPVSWSTEPVGTTGMTLLHFTSANPEELPSTTVSHLRRSLAPEAPVRLRNGTREQAYEIIRARFDDPHFSTSVLAAEMHLSARSLQILFHDIGCSPAAELRRIRLEHAYATLEHGHSVRAACLLSGFLDPDAFGRTFRRHFGHSPSQVRRRVLLPAG